MYTIIKLYNNYKEEIQQIKNKNGRQIIHLLNKNQNIKFIFNTIQQIYPILNTNSKILFFIKNDFTELPKCQTCGKQFFHIYQVNKLAKCCSKQCLNKFRASEKYQAKIKQTFINNFGVDNPSKSEIIKRKKQQTTFSHYGVLNPYQAEEIKEKIKQTWQENYQCDNPRKNEEINQKVRNTCVERYGGNSPAASPIVLEKMIKTCYEKYGCANSHQNEDVKNKTIYTASQILIKNMWDTILSWNNYVIPLFQKHEFIRNKPQKWKCTLCNTQFEQMLHKTNHLSHIHPKIPRCLNCFPLKKSIGQLQLKSFLSTYFQQIIEHNRTIIAPYQLDFYIPQINLAIQFNGDYWHSIELGKPHNYHLMKTNMCEQKNIRLIHIWQNQWTENSQYIKQKLQNIFKNKEIIDYNLLLDRSWYQNINIPNYKKIILQPEIILRHDFHVENCGYIKYIPINSN